MTLANHPKNQKSDEGRLTVQMFLQPNHEGANIMKSWTYEEITNHTEDRIRKFMEKAQQSKELNRTYEYDMYRAWAAGAYQAWYDLTCGWQEIGDDERLDALTKANSIDTSTSTSLC